METDFLTIIGLIFIGIVIGMVLSLIFIFVTFDNFVNNVLPKIQIENVNFNLNETELVKAMNNTLGGTIIK